MAKNRRKKRRKRRGGQAAAPQPPVLRPSGVAPEERPDVVAARPSGPGTEGTVVGTVVEVERESIWIEVGGQRARIYASELMLGIGERPADRYAVGDRFEAFVFQMGPEPDLGATQFSIRRASPYPEALAGLEVEAEVQAMVVNTYDVGVELDIGGVRGNALHGELPLQPGESPHQRYEPGETIESVLVWWVNQEARDLFLSVKRGAPGYPEALQRRAVGDVVSGTITGVSDGGWLLLDVDGLVGGIAPDELILTDEESARERYAVGDTVEGLFVWGVNQEARDLFLSVKRGAPGYLEALQRRAVGDVVSGTITGVSDGGWLLLDVDGLVGGIAPDELILTDEESARERYAVGDTVEGLFVWGVDHEARRLSLSVKRGAPDYVEALNAHSAGEVVSATITDFQSNGGLWLDVDGVIGSVAPDELVLAGGESARERYAVGETIDGLFVWQVDHDDRHLSLSVKRNAPGYVEALQRRAVGEIVSGTVTAFWGNGGLWLDVDGLVGAVGPQELGLAEGESARERYAVGETIDGLFVWQVDHEHHDLALSVKRNTPGYAEALQRHAVGDVVSATVTDFQPNGGLWLDVDGLVGSVLPRELVLADGESARERYAVGETIDDLFVWQVDHEDRGIALSVKRNAPGYLEALGAIARGNEVSGTVTGVTSGGLWLDIDGAIGWIFKEEALVEDGEALAERYSVGDPVTAVVGHIDRESRTVLLSARQVGLTLVEEPIVLRATIKAMVVRKRDGGIDVSVDGGNEIEIPDYALSLRPGGSPDLERGQKIDVVVMDTKDGAPTVLSRRRALDGWEAARDRLAAGVVVPDARVIPWVDRPNRDDGRAAVDLGPITGFIPLDERDAGAAEDLMSRRANRRHGVVIEGLDEDVWTASVSEVKFEARWRELVDNLPTDEGIEGEIVDITRGVATLDLGFGLLGEMSASELPPANGDERIGESVTVGIRSVDREEYRVTVEFQNYELVQMIAGNESATCEFKAVFQGQREGDSKEVRSGYPVARAMAGMMNRDGGHVLVGVYEDPETKKGVVIGWEESGFDTEDGFVNELSKVVGEMLSTEAGGLYGVRFEALPSGKRIVDIECRRAERPIFAKKAWVRRARAEFFVRYEGATRRPADDRELYEYIMRRFYGRDA